MKSAPSIAFEYRPSRIVAAAAGLVAFAAATAPWLSAMPAVLRVTLTVAVSIFSVTALAHFLRGAYHRIGYSAAGWRLFDGAGAACAGVLVAHRRIGDWLALDFRTEDGVRFRALLGPDNLDADTRRRLVLLLARSEVAQAA